MKTVLRLTVISVLLGLMSLTALAANGPQTMPVSCKAPKPEPQSGLNRIKGDGDTWTFQVALEGGARFVDGPYWNYPGKDGNDPDWGLWTGGEDGESSLSWSSPEKTGSFSVGVHGKIACGSGGGEAIDFAAGWSGHVAFNAEIQVRRKESGDEYSSSATVAAGGKSTSEHQADVKVIATDDDSEPLEGISVPAPTIQNGNGVNADAGISPSSATTNAQGEAFFTFTSSDIVDGVRLEVDGGESSASADVTHDWTNLPDGSDPGQTWEFEPYFDYDIASNIIFKMALKSNGDVPITNHNIQFKTTALAGWEWNPDAGEDWNEDGYPDGDYEYVDLEDYNAIASVYGDLVTYSSISEGPAGHYTTQQTVYSDEDFWVDEVIFDAIDWNADDGQ